MSKTMDVYPLVFQPLLKHRVWGGRRLVHLGKRLPPDEIIGESWEIADLPETVDGGQSCVANGPLTGQTLRSLIQQDPVAILGSGGHSDEPFPLLIKFLDAEQNLSVQVHPPQHYVDAHPEAALKSEAWVILDAQPDAKLYIGLREGLSAEMLIAHVEAGTLQDELIQVDAHVGDCHYLPAGTCHALGAGIVVAEIQTPSDTTFRVYDWDRTDREMHVAEAAACIDFEHPVPPEPLHEAIEKRGEIRIQRLCVSPFFTIDRLEAVEDDVLPLETGDQPVIIMATDGRARLVSDRIEDDVIEIDRGMTTLIPAALMGWQLELQRGCTLLEVRPSAT